MSEGSSGGSPGQSQGVTPPTGPTTVGIPLGPAFAVQQVQVWQGQFPPPDAIERYEAVCPGTFDRLVSMAEGQQKAFIEANAEARRFQRADNQRGQYLGFAVTVLAIVAAIICSWFGQPWIAAALVGVPVLSVAKALIESARASADGLGRVPAVPDKRESEAQPSLPFE